MGIANAQLDAAELQIRQNCFPPSLESYYVCNTKSYHRAQKVRWIRFRYADADEPPRFAPRTLTAIITMKGATPRNERNRRKKVGTIIIGLYFC